MTDSPKPEVYYVPVHPAFLLDYDIVQMRSHPGGLSLETACLLQLVRDVKKIIAKLDKESPSD